MIKKYSRIVLFGALAFNGGNAAHASSNEYMGSSFQQVWDVVQDRSFSPQTEKEANEFKIYEDGFLPLYPVNALSVFQSGDVDLKHDALRTTSQRFDYYDRLPKKLHPNGVCVAGEWTIQAKTPFTGMLATGAKGLFIGRISVAMGETMVDEYRGFGVAGKVFPTINPNEVVKTGNFFTIDVLSGTKLEHVLDAKTTNQPELGHNFSVIGLGLRIAAALTSADQNPAFRPLTQVAAAGMRSEQTVAQPRWIRLSVAQKLKRNNQLDFRNEVIIAMDENRELIYNIEVSNTTANRNAEHGWTKVGQINLNQAIISYGCDRRLHFSHPKLK